MPTVAEVVAALDRRFPPSAAESWDAVGPVCGDPDAEVRRVLFAVDPVAAVVDEAIDFGADLLVTHHPLFLRGTTSVWAGTPKGRLVHRLVTNGCALLAVHTNADVAAGGVAEALARALGLVDLIPLRALPTAVDKLTVFVPAADADRVLDALATAGAGRIGDYERCGYWTDGTGTFRPIEGAQPTVGAVGSVEQVVERRLEMVLPRERRTAVVATLRAAHPYEEPAFDLVETVPDAAAVGSGRIGRLPEATSLARFAEQVVRSLPATPVGVRVAGDPDLLVERVAVCGGAGDAYLADAARAGVDVFVTGDLRHHPASEHLEGGGPALVDPGHWASEWPWLDLAATRLAEDLAGTTVDIRVSSVVTDPWTAHLPGRSPR